MKKLFTLAAAALILSQASAMGAPRPPKQLGDFGPVDSNGVAAMEAIAAKTWQHVREFSSIIVGGSPVRLVNFSEFLQVKPGSRFLCLESTTDRMGIRTHQFFLTSFQNQTAGPLSMVQQKTLPDGVVQLIYGVRSSARIYENEAPKPMSLAMFRPEFYDPAVIVVDRAKPTESFNSFRKYRMKLMLEKKQFPETTRATHIILFEINPTQPTNLKFTTLENDESPAIQSVYEPGTLPIPLPNSECLSRDFSGFNGLEGPVKFW